MNTTELKDKFRTEVFDNVSPHFWSDEEIFEYMNDAQSMFCRLVEGIQDSSSDVTKITVVTGEAFADLSPKVLKIRKATLASNFRDVALMNAEDIWNSPTVDYGLSPTPKLDNTTGPIQAIVLGMEQDQVRLISIPLVDDVINLVTYRLPLVDIIQDGQTLEIASQHHIYLLHWMKYRAYSKHDAEIFDSEKASDFENRFIGYCNQARIETETRKHKHRTVQYGGL